MKIKFPVTNNTLYWASMFCYQAEAYTHMAKYEKNEALANNYTAIAGDYVRKCKKMLEEGWKPPKNFVYAMDSMIPQYTPDLTHFGLHKFTIPKPKGTSHKRKSKELRDQPQCKCKHFNYDHNKGKCIKCNCEGFRI